MTTTSKSFSQFARRFFITLLVPLLLLNSFSLPQAKAADETGHINLSELVYLWFGLNPDLARHASALNGSLDIIKLGGALPPNPFAGAASTYGHFANPSTPLDDHLIDEDAAFQTFKKLVHGALKGLTAHGVAEIANSAAYEMLMRGFRTNDSILFFMGLHTLMDVAGGFHNDYMGSITSSRFFKVLFQIPVGHWSNGTDNDRLTPQRIKLTLRAFAPILIAFRQRQMNNEGINLEWLQHLKSQGVDIDNPNSMVDHFLDDPFVQNVLIDELPARTNPKYLRGAFEIFTRRFEKHNAFKTPESMRVLGAELMPGWIAKKLNEMEMMSEFIDEAWKRGLLNEDNVLKDAFTGSITGATELQRLVSYENSEERTENGGPLPFTRDWVIDRIIYGYLKGAVHIPYHKWKDGYLVEDLERLKKDLDLGGVQKIQQHFFGETTLFVDKPARTFWKAVFSQWNQRLKTGEFKGMADEILGLAEAISTTVIDQEKSINTLSLKYYKAVSKRFLGFLLSKSLLNIVRNSSAKYTDPGTQDLVDPANRQQLVEELGGKFGSFMSKKDIEEIVQENRTLNKKYNSTEPVGWIQKAAKKYVDTFGPGQAIRSCIRALEKAN